MSNDSKRGHRAHALSHQACPYVLGISRLAPPCAIAIRIAHFSNLRELDVYLSALLHPPAKLPLWLGGNKKILAKSCAFERKNLQIVHKIKRKFNAVSSCCERGKARPQSISIISIDHPLLTTAAGLGPTLAVPAWYCGSKYDI